MPKDRGVRGKEKNIARGLAVLPANQDPGASDTTLFLGESYVEHIETRKVHFRETNYQHRRKKKKKTSVSS